MEPEPVSKTSIAPPPSPPPPPHPPPPPPSSSTQPETAANVPVTGSRRKNLSFSWSSSSSTSSFNSLIDSFKKDDINIHDLPQQQQRQQPITPPQPSSSSSGRFGSYDPNRIPSSIFDKPSNQADWSIASNESLFSIHNGNNSFSLGEFALPNYEPINNYPPASAPAPETRAASNNPFGLPVTAEEEFEVEEFGRKSSSIWEDFHENNDPPPVITHPPEIVVTENEESPPSATAATAVPGGILLLESCSNISDQSRSFSAGSSRMSEESGNSCNSFAFPLLTSEGSTNDHLSMAPPASMGTSMGTENERKPPPQPSPKRESIGNANPAPPQTTKAGWGGNEEPPHPENHSSWFSYLCCCSINCHCCGRSRGNCLSHGNKSTNERLDK